MTQVDLSETYGYVLDDTTVGELSLADNNDGGGVKYTHKKAAQNAIWFYARTGEKAVCNIAAIPIHDHSSLVQGGPAFGTYFNDNMAVSDEDSEA